MFGDWEIARAVAELLSVEALQVNGREVSVAADALGTQSSQDLIAVLPAEFVLWPDYVNEPTHVHGVERTAWKNDRVHLPQNPIISRGDLAAHAGN